MTPFEIYGSFGVIGAVLLLPLLVKKVEHNIEAFLFVMGCLAVAVTGTFSSQMLPTLVTEPLPITGAVLVFGLLFYFGRKWIERGVIFVAGHMPLPLFLFLTSFVLGLASSVITAVMAALLLVEIVAHIKLTRKGEVWFVVMACFAIGIGATLTPLGEPLATIVISKLHGDFFFLFRLVGWHVLALVTVVSLLASRAQCDQEATEHSDAKPERTAKESLLRAGKVYVFIMALILLGAGLAPLAMKYIAELPAGILFWANSVSAILDNATLAAAEVTPSMQSSQLIAALLGLLVSGGMLIPGNIPNIIAADHLKIRSSEWARIGVPVGFALMLGTYLVVFYFHM
jgi:predicted cation transporter